MVAEIARLHDRIGPAAVPDRRRDVFRFSSQPAPDGGVRPADVHDRATPDAPPNSAPEKPALTLIGIAEDEAADGPVRTAVVSGLNDLFLVKTGDRIGEHLRVEAIGAGSVELLDTATDARVTLVLH